VEHYGSLSDHVNECRSINRQFVVVGIRVLAFFVAFVVGVVDLEALDLRLNRRENICICNLVTGFIFS